jgi:hypothetical protein
MRRIRRLLLFGTAVLLYGTVLTGCSHQPGLPAGGENPAGNQSLPFDRASEKSGISPTEKLVPTSIPGGTAITVRLQTPVSSASSAAGDSFDAVLDESLVVGGHLVVPHGAVVTGRVVGARASRRPQDPGYLRLALTAISINGRSYPLPTSSIFVKGGSHDEQKRAMSGGTAAAGAVMGSATGARKGALIGTAAGAADGTGAAHAGRENDVGFRAEHRLTFRLSQPLSLQN